jgi:hypothetical protein
MGADKNIFSRFNHNKVFLETGSFLGGGINQAYHAGYRNIISIELSDHYYEHCKNLYKNHSSFITLYHGDSGVILGDIISKIDQPITFWLDGHYSGGAESNIPETAGAGLESPLYRELEFISLHPIKTHTILIDDVEGRQDIEKLKEKILSINSSYKFEFATPEEFRENSVLVASTPYNYAS